MLFGLSSLHAQGQGFEAPRGAWPDKQLAPLEELITRALVNSPNLKIASSKVERSQYEKKLEQGNWGRLISLGGAFRYGNGALLTGNLDDTETNYALRTTESFNYNIGVSIGLPLSEFFSRGKVIKLKQLALDQAEWERENVKTTIREEVVNRYQSFLLSVKLLEGISNAVGHADLAFAVIDKQFKEGNVTITEYAQALEMKTAKEIQLHQARAECEKALIMLREIVGQDIF